MRRYLYGDQNCTAVAEIGLECGDPELLMDELWQSNSSFGEPGI